MQYDRVSRQGIKTRYSDKALRQGIETRHYDNVVLSTVLFMGVRYYEVELVLGINGRFPVPGP